jgi:hypothetical protein
MATVKNTPKRNTASQSSESKSNNTKDGPQKAGIGNSKKDQANDSNQNQSSVAERSLLFKGAKNKLLSPGQKKFNRLIEQLENQQKRVNAKALEMDQMLDFYAKQIYPFQTKENQLGVSYVKALFLFYKRKRRELSPAEHQLLGRLVKLNFEKIDVEIINKDPELHVIWKKLYKKSYAESMQEDLNEFKVEAIEQLFEMGIDFDPVEIESITDFDKLHEKIHQLIQEFNDQEEQQSNDAAWNPFEQSSVNEEDENGGRHQQARQQSFDFGDEFDYFENEPPKNKTTAQQKKERIAKEKEAIKQKSISSIYKQLAKIFHPDLERDEDKKVEKEALMQQLTQAYQQKDLHTLLRLELGWIHKEEDNIQQMTDDKLDIYNEILKEQIKELKIEEMEIESHPKYDAILCFDDCESPTLPMLKKELRVIKKRHKIMTSQAEILNMNNAASIVLLKDVLHDFDLQTKEAFGLESFLSLLAGQADFDWE